MKSLKKCWRQSFFFLEQRFLIKFSVEVGKIPVQTKMFLDSSSCRPSVSRALVYSGISNLVTAEF